MKEDDEHIEYLVQNTGCDAKLATMLLQFTGGDFDGARRIIEAVPKDIFAIKVKFIAQVTGYYGALLFCYDEKENHIKRFISVTTDDTEIGKIDLTQKWIDFEETLYDYIKTKAVDSVKIERLKEKFLDKGLVDRISKVLKVGNPVKDDVLNNLLVDELYDVFSDTNIAVKFHVEMTDVFELNKGQSVSDIDEDKTINSEEVDDEIEDRKMKKKADQSLIILKIDPILSPVKGTEIKELEFGDDIQVRITDERDIADYLAVLLGGKVGSMRVPIYTKIVEVKDLEAGGVGVLTQFGPGIMGKFKVPSEVKVVSKKEQEEEETQIVTKKKDINPLFIVGGIVLIITVFLLLIFLAR